MIKKLLLIFNSLEKKILSLTLMGVLLSCILVGTFSFLVAKNALVSNVSQNNTNTIKQISNSLDERIASIKNLSFLMSQDSEIIHRLKNLNIPTSSIELSKQNSIFKRSVVLHASNTSYIEDAYLTNLDLDYVLQYQSFTSKNNITIEKLKNILAYNGKSVTNWVSHNDNLFLLRRVIDRESNNTIGYLVFQVSDSFLEFGSISELLSDDKIIILNHKKKNIKKGKPLENTNWPELFKINNISNYETFYSSVEFSKKKYVLSVANLGNEDWSIIGLVSQKELLAGLSPIYLIIFIGIIIIGFILAGLVFKLTSTISNSVRSIKKGIDEYEKGNLLVKITTNSSDELGDLANSFNAMGSRLNQLIWELNLEQEKKNLLEFQTLKAQINPHFLYNTLESIKWFSFNQGQDEISSAIDSLIQLLKITIKNSTSMITINEEISYVENYVILQKMRYGNDLIFTINNESDSENILIPGFILQPFIENSILHGIDLSNKKGEISLTVKQSKTFITFIIKDNGVGISPNKIKSIYSSIQSESTAKNGFNGLGIGVIVKRLKYFFEDEYEFKITSSETGATVIVSVPIYRKVESK